MKLNEDRSRGRSRRKARFVRRHRSSPRRRRLCLLDANSAQAGTARDQNTDPKLRHAGAEPSLVTAKDDSKSDEIAPGIDGGASDPDQPYVFRRQPTFYRTLQPVGTIIVDKLQHFLYLIRAQQCSLALRHRRRQPVQGSCRAASHRQRHRVAGMAAAAGSVEAQSARHARRPGTRSARGSWRSTTAVRAFTAQCAADHRQFGQLRLHSPCQ